VKKTRRDYESYLQSRLKRDQVTAKARSAVLAQDGTKQQALEAQLGLTECA
jgi:hypothetical protein